MADPNIALLHAMALALGSNALPGIVAQPIRAGIVLQRLQRIALLTA